jgi:hypothetical protein
VEEVGVGAGRSAICYVLRRRAWQKRSELLKPEEFGDKKDQEDGNAGAPGWTWCCECELKWHRSIWPSCRSKLRLLIVGVT